MKTSVQPKLNDNKSPPAWCCTCILLNFNCKSVPRPLSGGLTPHLHLEPLVSGMITSTVTVMEWSSYLYSRVRGSKMRAGDLANRQPLADNSQHKTSTFLTILLLPCTLLIWQCVWCLCDGSGVGRRRIYHPGVKSLTCPEVMTKSQLQVLEGQVGLEKTGDDDSNNLR